MRDPHLDARLLLAEERAIGCALWLPADEAREIVTLLHHEDIASPAVQLVRRIVAELCEAGVRPGPGAVLDHALRCKYVAGETQILGLTRTLWDLYDHRVTTPATWPMDVAAALEQSWRRRVTEMSDRLRQVAETASTEELERLTAAEQAAVEAIRTRRRALTERTAVAA